MDAQLALTQVDEFLNLCDVSILIQEGDSDGWNLRGQWQQTDREITRRLVVIQPIAQEIAPQIRGVARTPMD